MYIFMVFLGHHIGFLIVGLINNVLLLVLFVSILVHAANCRPPLVDCNVKLNYTSTLEGSVLTLTCENEIPNINTSTTDKQSLSITCHSNGDWIPNPANFIKSCSSFTTAPPGILHSVNNDYQHVFAL